MTLKEYRQQKGITVRKLTEELKQIDPRFTIATVSYMEHGVVEPPESVKVYLAGKQIEENIAPLTDAEEIALGCLMRHSKEIPATRRDFKLWGGLNDRTARDAIEGLRKRGFWVVNGECGGYYITTDREEMEEWLKTYTSRARTINKVASAMRAADPTQIEM